MKAQLTATLVNVSCMPEFDPAPIFVEGTIATDKVARAMTTVDFILSVLSKIGAGFNSQTRVIMLNYVATIYIAPSELP